MLYFAHNEYHWNSELRETKHQMKGRTEWKEDIDEQRAQEAKKRAEEMIAKGGLSDHDYKIVEAKLQRALVRLSVKS